MFNTALAGFALAAVSFSPAFGASTNSSVALLRQGRSDYRIVLDGEASASNTYAAKELQSHFEACTGVSLPIVRDAPEGDVPMIVLGAGALAKTLGVDPSEAQLGEQGCVLRTVAPHLVIAGTSQGGTLYGVHRFLQAHLGVRWYAPGVTKTPQVSDLVLPKIDRLIQPAFLFRQTSYAWPGADQSFRVRQGENAGKGGADSQYGAQYAFSDGRAHSYFRYVSPGEFFETHPEYFSEKGGERIRTETQLCLTNPEVLRIVTERMLARMKAHPKARQHNFSQMDYYNYCECDRCTKMNAKYGTQGGTQFWFVNRLAEATSKVYPDKLVGTLAYTFTEEPPRGMKMHPNVAVWLCHMFPSCDSHPIATCPRDADYKRRAQTWAKLCDHLYVWHYVVDFAHYYNPFPNLRAMAADMRFYRDIGVEGIYLQAMGHRGGGGEFSLLRPYYGTQLLWDPDQDADAILRDFLEGYYGAAWEPIWKYIQMLHDEVADPTKHMHLYTNPAQGYLPDRLIRRAMGLFDEAEARVKADATLLERVRVARMPIDYARMFPRNGYEIKDGKLVWLGNIASLDVVIRFLQRMKDHGFETIRELGGSPEQLIGLSGMLNTRMDVRRIQNGHLAVDVVPMLGGRALRIIDLRTGQCVTAHNVKPNLFFPFCGGLDHRVGEISRFYGWMEPAMVLSGDQTSVTLKSRMMNGLDLTRTMTLDPDEPVMHVRVELTNPGKKPVEVRLRSHLELDLGALDDVRIAFRNSAGDDRVVPASEIIAGLREGQRFHEGNLPGGEWSFIGGKGLVVKQRFDSKPLDFCWAYAYPADLGELEVELWAKRKMLQPKESTAFDYEIEVRPAGGASSP